VRKKHSERSLQILKALDINDGSALDVSKRLRVAKNLVNNLLLRLRAGGYVRRDRVQQGVVIIDKDEHLERKKMVYVYSITKSGVARKKRLEEELA
jgi:Mn-dependent DtxR family transcriptional regulator